MSKTCKQSSATTEHTAEDQTDLHNSINHAEGNIQQDGDENDEEEMMMTMKQLTYHPTAV